MLAVVAGMLSSCGIRRHKYDDPIAKNTQQPDKVLFDRAINDIDCYSRFEIARLTLVNADQYPRCQRVHSGQGC